MNAVFSTSFFPPIAYVSELYKAENPIIDVKENYIKQSYRNRCAIYSPNGKLLLSVPVVKGRSPQTPADQISISYAQNWQARHWRAIESAYRSSPYFEFYEDELKPFFVDRYDKLIDYNKEILETIFAILGFEKQITYSDNYVEMAEFDFRKLTAKNPEEYVAQKNYTQVFQEKHGFLTNMSILDLIFCEGPNTLSYL